MCVDDENDDNHDDWSVGGIIVSVRYLLCLSTPYYSSTPWYVHTTVQCSVLLVGPLHKYLSNFVPTMSLDGPIFLLACQKGGGDLKTHTKTWLITMFDIVSVNFAAKF